ncbi:MAG: two-component system sensor histidine kinase NtrB [Bryobacteraceae bacterium]
MNQRTWTRFVRPQDLVWLLLFSALAAVSPRQGEAELEMLAALALLQVIGPKIPYFDTPRGNLVSIILKLVLSYLLIGVTGGIASSYYVLLLLPVVSAATTLGMIGTLIFTLASCASYLSFLLFVEIWGYKLLPEQFREVILRVFLLPVVGYLTHQLAEDNRVQARKYQAAALQLAEANESLRQAEAAMRRSERLAALGQLSAGLAHELRNPMGTVKASAEMLSKRVEDSDPVVQELAGFISSEVDRTNSLITRFLEFARPLQLKRRPADIADVVDRAVEELSRHHPPYPVTVYKNASPDIRPAEIDAELVQRVVYNLLLNAAQATPAGGTITVKTRQLGDRIEIAVIDRGSGIDPSLRENIFNPFFTTKPDGVGLGLAIVSKIVDEHGGKLSVESEPGRGSVFRVWLPAGA